MLSQKRVRNQFHEYLEAEKSLAERLWHTKPTVSCRPMPDCRSPTVGLAFAVNWFWPDCETDHSDWLFSLADESKKWM